jgi:hypothetical protein
MATHHLVVRADGNLTVTHAGCPLRMTVDGDDRVVHACDVQAHLDAVGASDIVGATDRVGDVPPGEYPTSTTFPAD